MVDVFKLLILAAVILAPMWIMASELDGDEFGKSAAGIAAGGVTLAALKMLENLVNKRVNKRNGKNGDKS